MQQRETIGLEEAQRAVDAVVQEQARDAASPWPWSTTTATWWRSRA